MYHLPATPVDDAPPAYAAAAGPLPADHPLPGLVDHERLGLDFAELEVSGPCADTRAHLAADGTVDVWVNVKQPAPGYDFKPQPPPLPPRRTARLVVESHATCPPLNIVIFVVGSRGDVQPYLALALRLVATHGHRVRIATHPPFRDFVLGVATEHLGAQSRQLEFFDIGGDPKALMEFMVKNPGLMPGFESLTNGDVSSKRRMAGEMLQGFYRSCFEPDSASGAPFAADAIVANPPSFAHIHCAEAFGLPLVMSFTMPWSPARRFAHPLVNVQSSNAEPGLTNYLSYALADTLMWQGLGDIINRFRVQLGRGPLTALTGPMATERLRVPFVYAWSPSLLPKADEWKEHIDVVGFFTMPTATSYTPDAALAKFLDAGLAPVYIGFGSIVVSDPDALTRLILDAITKAGVRAVLSAGWSDLGGVALPETVHLLKSDIPHDWLFAKGRVCAAVHHGGAGTTSASLRAGLPTVVVPFFGDQKFWGTAVALAGAGPRPIPYKSLTATRLAEGIAFALSETPRTAAAAIGASIRSQDGTRAGADAVLAALPLNTMRCGLDPARSAQWWCPKYALRLSSVAAGVLVARGHLSWRHLSSLRPSEYATARTYTDPFTACSQAALGAVTTGVVGLAQLFSTRPMRGLEKLTWGMVKGGAEIVAVTYEGFENLPRMMGTRVRPRVRVDNFGDGLREGVKAFGVGWMDALSGVVTEPMDGYSKSGYAGGFGGVWTSMANLLVRPLTGSFAFLVHPTVGAYRSIVDWMSAGGPLVAARRDASIAAAEAASADERGMIALKYKDAVRSERTKLRKRAELARRREREAAEGWKGVGVDEMEDTANRAWWERALPPPRPRGASAPTVLSESGGVGGPTRSHLEPLSRGGSSAGSEDGASSALRGARTAVSEKRT